MRFRPRCSRQGRIGTCDLPAGHPGRCTMTEITTRSDLRTPVPIDLQYESDPT